MASAPLLDREFLEKAKAGNITLESATLSRLAELIVWVFVLIAVLCEICIFSSPICKDTASCHQIVSASLQLAHCFWDNASVLLTL